MNRSGVNDKPIELLAWGLLFLLSMGGCGYGVSQAIRDARSVGIDKRQKALDRLTVYISKTTGSKGREGERRAAIRALGDVKLPGAAGPLRMVLQHETSSPLRQEAIRSLSRLKAVSALQELREALMNDKDLDVRMLAAATLGRVGDRRALQDLVQALQDKQPAVRTAAIRALIALKAKNAAPHLIDALCDKHPDVLGEASRALIQMKQQAIPLLVKELDQSATRRPCVVRFFPKLGEEALVPLIKAFAEKSKRAAATQALHVLTQDRKTWPVFAKMLDNPNTYDGRKELDALKAEGSLATIHAAFALWYELPVRYRLIFRDLLGVIARKDEEKGRAILTRAALSGPDLAYKVTAVIALGGTGPAALKVLRSFLESPTRALVVSAMMGLGKVGEKGLPVLMPYISSKDEGLRIVAFRAMGQIKSPKAMQILLDGLKDKAAKIRIEALRGLAVQKDTSQIPTIRKMLSDPIIDVVMTAIQTLLKLGDTRNVMLYIQALRRGPYPPKHEFVRTLGELGDKRAVPLLRKLADRYLRSWQRYQKQAKKLYKRGIRKLKRKGERSTQTEAALKEEIKQKLKEDDAVNPMALCAFFEAIRALLKFNYPAHKVLGEVTFQDGDTFNPLSRPVDQCPWPSFRAQSAPSIRTPNIQIPTTVRKP